MKTYPLESISIEKAMQNQFRFVDCIMQNFTGFESLSRGDLGIHQPENEPLTTIKAEKAIAQYFGAEACALIRGSGTGAIRFGLAAIIGLGEKILIHDAPAYSTTQTSFEMSGLNVIRANFNDLEEIDRVMKENPDIKASLVQYSRQKIEDNYDIKEVIARIKSNKDVPIITDDNYVAMKTDGIGYEFGADLSTFSTFKLQGPEGIGCIVGKKQYIDKIRKMMYSGGSQVQGFEAMEVLRGMTYASVMLAISAKQIEEVYRRLSEGEVEGIKNVYIANAQSKVILIEFEKPIAKEILLCAEKLGALPHPVGSESKYEIEPLFYRVSGTFLKTDPTLIDRMIRVNVNRAGADTVIRVLREGIKMCEEAQNG